MAKIIIVGVGGIGAATARGLVASGHEAFLIGRNVQATQGLAAELQCGSAIADVTDGAALAAAVAAAGPVIDGLCYAVGTINLKPLARLTDVDFRRDFEVNALGAAQAVQAVLPALKASTLATASVLLFSSVAVAQGFTGHASIGMAKGAVEGLVKSLAAVCVALKAEGFHVDYVRLDDLGNTHSFTRELQRAVARHDASLLIVIQAREWRVHQMMKGWAEAIGIDVERRTDDRFLYSRSDFAKWAEGRRSFRMEFFYREMRKMTGLLMRDGKPEGNAWNFDAENRKRLPNDAVVPKRISF